MTTPGPGPARAVSRRKPPHVLANARFRRLWMAMSVCSLGDWLNIIALTALAGNLTQGSGYQTQSLAIGGVFVAKMLPAILLGPLAGAVADRFDRRLAMVAADLLRFALVVSIPVVMLVSTPSPGTYQWVIIVTLLVECVNLFWVPAKDATVPNLVPKDRLEEANQLNLLVTYGTAPVAAALFALLALPADLLRGVVPILADDPARLALFINAAVYLVSAFLIFTLPDFPKNHTGISTPSVLRQIGEGWRFVGASPIVRGLVIGMAGAFAAGGAVIGVARVYVVKGLGGGDAAYGTVFGAVFVGMACGMFFGPRLMRELSRRRLFGLAIVAAGAVLATTALIHNLVLVVLLTVLLGACAGIAWIIGYTLIGLEVEDQLRGRTFAFLQSLARVVLLLVVAVAPTLAGLYGERDIKLGPNVDYSFDGSNLVLLIGAVLATVVGVVALRQMDDRKGVPIATDLLAALRGHRYAPDQPERPRGIFIAFEGGEGSGKTTQSRLLAIWLRDQGFDVVQTREPGSTKVGMRLRAILLDAAHQGLSPRSEALLYAADRAEHVEKVIMPALTRGAVVVTDRYVDSSLAYQGAGRSLDRAEVVRLNGWATGGLVPDLTVLIDVPPSVGLTRFASPADRIESEPLEFHERVRREFRALAAAEPDRYVVIDGTLTQAEVNRLIQDRVREILPDPVPHDSEDSTGTMPAIRD
ncbi:dTMP kinase [Spongiactinospora gelatinilytica]|uniref:Thymidylate kinase n=1 Tax=Spongiactinospora gelatinilytica TaxID=2666298 RepID=A0A2W2GCC8_9ACTN|nr:dTMP kinase [Spongiactinospora gelatinilytica]PZG34578.1 dTMP kinase [Spongiactinospora gelatinilytica]